MPPISKKLNVTPAAPVTNNVVLNDGNRYVHIEKSVTKNMGDGNYAKVSIGATLPIDFTDADVDKAHEAITACIELVDQRIEEEVDALMPQEPKRR
jgi:hypothetical protein